MQTSPDFLRLISNDLRWQLLKALSHSDLRVQELVRRIGQPQNLVSYHLRLLLEKGLVDEHRSLADARSIYYSINLDRIEELYALSGQSLHPALIKSKETMEGDPINSISHHRVLFLCTHNSARSQMAEALLRARSGGGINVFSAGTEPTEVNALAVQALAELNIDMSSHRAKSLEEFIGQPFDYVITVCDRAREACPVFPGDPVLIHWSFPDPMAAEETDLQRYEIFKKTAVQLNTRIGYLLIMMRQR